MAENKIMNAEAMSNEELDKVAGGILLEKPDEANPLPPVNNKDKIFL